MFDQTAGTIPEAKDIVCTIVSVLPSFGRLSNVQDPKTAPGTPPLLASQLNVTAFEPLSQPAPEIYPAEVFDPVIGNPPGK